MCFIAALPALGLANMAIGTAVASTALSAYGAYQQSAYAKGAAQSNAQVADLQAQDALRRGDEQAGAARRQADQAVGKVRAGYSARGVDVASGTAADVAQQTDFFGQMDSATARTNADREAWALRARAGNFRAEASAQNPLLATASTILGGASQVADKWYRYGGH